MWDVYCITGLHFYDSTLYGRKVSLNVNFPPPWLGDPAFSTQREQRPFYQHNAFPALVYMHSFLILDDFLMLKFPGLRKKMQKKTLHQSGAFFFLKKDLHFLAFVFVLSLCLPIGTPHSITV